MGGMMEMPNVGYRQSLSGMKLGQIIIPYYSILTEVNL